MRWTDRIGRRVKLRDLHILLAVIHSRSMGKAASELAVSQPAVSKAVSDLEHALGVRLLDRTPHGVEPTLYGRTLLKWGMAAFEDLRQGVNELERLADPAGGELRVGATEPLAAGLVPRVIDALSRRHPRALFRIVPADRVTLLENELRQRKVDLIVTPTDGLHPEPDAEVHALFDDVHMVMAGRKSKWLRRRALKLADLADEPWVLPPYDSIAGASIANAFRQSGVEPPRARIVSLSVPLTCNLLSTGRYLTMLPVSMLHLAAHLPVKLVPVRSPQDHRPTAIMTLKNRTVGALTERFIECARETVKTLKTAGRYTG